MNLNSFLKAPAKFAILQKEYLANIYSHNGPIYLVNEYPKSGGTWLKFMLSDTLELPAWTRGNIQWNSCVMQAHWLAPRRNCKTIALFRDGRDVMVSYYYHSFFRNEFQNSLYVELMRNKFSFTDYEDIQSNLLPFMKVMIDQPVSPKFSWVEFARFWGENSEASVCRYEDLRNDAAKELVRLKQELQGECIDYSSAQEIAEKYSMQNMRKRKADLNPNMMSTQTTEKSFIRKGSVGGWSEHFTDESLEWFEGRAGSELELLGYSLGRP